MKRLLALQLVNLGLRLNALAVRCLNFADRLLPTTPSTSAGRLTPRDYTAVVQAVRAQSLLDPAGKQRHGVRA